MPIDPAMSQAMLGTFRDLLADAQGKGLTGPDVDEMGAALAAMDGLAATMNDVAEFSMKLANDGYYTRFTDAYTRAMLAAAGGGGAGPEAIADDEQLLAQSLQAYEGSLAQLRQMTNQEPAIGAIERILTIGRSGVTYPVFLREVEEEGLNEAMAGSITPSRVQLEADLDHARSVVDPAREAQAAAMIALRDNLAATSPRGAVDPFSFELGRYEIAWEHAPAIALRDALVLRLPRLVDLVVEWLDAHTSWAAHDSRFIGATAADTQRRIAMARECNPGFYEMRAAQFASYFGPLPWWERPELTQERAGGRILWTDARLALAVDAVAHCRPETPNAPAELVARAEAFGPNSF